MNPGSAEKDIQEFLARQSPWIRNLLQGEGLSRDDMQALIQQPGAFDIFFQAEDEYINLLKRCPSKLKEYRRRKVDEAVRSALSRLPQVPSGAPRKDWLAEEALELNRAGLSYGKVAIELNRRHGPNTTNAEAIRALIRSRKQSPPEKT
jgi:hypothetical protein